MAVRILDDTPSLGGLYAKAVLPSVPGLNRLRPAESSSHGPAAEPVDAAHTADTAQAEELPDLEVRLPGIAIDSGHLARYCQVCGFDPRRSVPATYAHVLAFPLHLMLMTEPDFPFPPLGLVHIANRIEQRRPLTMQDGFDLHVRAVDLRPHRRGSQLTLVSEALVNEEVLWRDETVVLRRHPEGSAEGAPTAPALPDLAPRGPIRWALDSGLGRRYASVSGDRNPIHLSRLTARAFGFPRPIAHGMWTKAKSLATLRQRVPDAFSVEVAFHKPIPLPSEVYFGARDTADGIDFGVASGGDRTHLVGRLTRHG